MTCIKSLQLLSIVICCTKSHAGIDLGQRKKKEKFLVLHDINMFCLTQIYCLFPRLGKEILEASGQLWQSYFFRARKWLQWRMLLFFFSPQGHGYYMFLFFGLIFERWQCIKLCMLRRWRLYKRAKSGRINRQRFKTFLDHVQAHVLRTRVLCERVSPVAFRPAICHHLILKAGLRPICGFS